MRILIVTSQFPIAGEPNRGRPIHQTVRALSQLADVRVLSPVARYPRWGFCKLFDRMRAEGRPWKHKRVHRLYCALRLNLPRRTTRRVPKRVRQPLAAPAELNRTWPSTSWATRSTTAGACVC
mgnify:CR=1 FL=1